MSTKRTYPVIGKLCHDGTPLANGDCVELTEAQAAPLLALGVISKPFDSVPDESTQMAEADEDMMQTIMDAIGQLKQPDDFTQSGRPRIKSLEPILGFEISTADLNPAWERFQEENK